MNKVVLIGHLTRDPELRTTSNDIPVASFTLAVNRRFKSQDSDQQADFIDCVAWRSTAEFIAKYFLKGSRIGVVGSIRTQSYEDKNGNRRKGTEVVVDEAEFVTSKAEKSGASAETPPDQQNNTTKADALFGPELSDFEPLDDAELPF